MKKGRKPTLKKFEISKLKNLNVIIGGGTDNGQGDTKTGHPTGDITTQISADTNCPDIGGD